MEDITEAKFETERVAIRKIKFTISDSGIGIKKDDIQKLFQVFGKLSSSASINPEGIGLGLIICSKIVREMGGEIKVFS